MDIKIYETGNGGDLQLNTNDLAIVYGVENMPYLAMFGGSSWWGNDLLMSQGNGWRFQAETEAVLRDTPLNSNGRLIIEAAIKRDLQFMLDIIEGTTLVVQTRITDDNTLEIRITFNGQEINLLWNPEAKKLTARNAAPTSIIIFESPIRTGTSSRYAITGFVMTQGGDTATFPVGKFTSTTSETDAVAAYNVLAVSYGMNGLFRIIGNNIVYQQGLAQSWAVTTSTIVLHVATEVRLKINGTPSGSPQAWSYQIGGIDSYSVTDFGDDSALVLTNPPTTSNVTVSRTYADGLEKKDVVIYTNDTLVKLMLFTNTSTVYRVSRLTTRMPLSLQTLSVFSQSFSSPTNANLPYNYNLSVIAFTGCGISSFLPRLLSGNMPLISIINLFNNNLSSTQVDAIFNDLVANTPESLTRAGTIIINGQTPAAPPTAASAAARALLTTAGWSITTD